MAEVVFSAQIRISGMLSSTVLRGLSATLSIAQTFVTHQFRVNDGESAFGVSFPALSNPTFVFCTATQRVRIGLGGHATVDSAASAGQEFRDFYGFAGEPMASGPTALYFANSSGNSAVVTVYLAQ